MRRLIVVVLISLALYGCSSIESINSASNSLNSNSIVTEPQFGYNPPEIYVEFAKIDMKNVEDLLFYNKNINKRVDDQNGEFTLSADDNTVASYYVSKLNSGFYINTPYMEYIYNIVNYVPADYSNNLESFSTTDELDFMDRETIKKRAVDLLHALNIYTFEPPSIYSLDHKTLESEELRKKNSGEYDEEINSGRMALKGDWSPDDDCYLLTFDSHLHGTPLSNTDHIIQKNQLISGSYITMVYSERGVESLSVSNNFVENGIVSSPDIISSDAAIDVINTKLNSIITDNPYKITNAELIYAPDFADKTQSMLILSPVWSISVTLTETRNGEEQTADFTYWVNAVTGKEVL